MQTELSNQPTIYLFCKRKCLELEKLLNVQNEVIVDSLEREEDSDGASEEDLMSYYSGDDAEYPEQITGSISCNEWYSMKPK